MSNDIIDHTQSQDDSQEAGSEERDLILSKIPVIVMRFDTNDTGEYTDTYISPAADIMLGLPAGTIGSSLERYLSYVHPEDLPGLKETLYELLQVPGSERSRIYRLVRPNGATLWVRFKGAAYHREDGKATVLGISSDITELKRLEELLAESKELLCQLWEHTNSGVAIYEPVAHGLDFIIKDINPACERIEGVSRKDVIGRSVLEVFPGLKEFGLLDVFQQVLRTGAPAYHPAKYYKDDRISGWRINYVSRLKSGDVIAIYQDITQEMQVHEELVKANAFLDSIIENIPDMIFIKEVSKLRFVRLNKAGEELLGCSRSELIGKNDYDLFPKEQADFFTSKDREVLAKRLVVDIPEEVIQTRHRGTRILHTKKISILDEDGNPDYLLGISEDITERKRVEDALRDAMDRYRSVVENSPDGIVVARDGIVLYVNPQIIKMLQASPEEIIGKPIIRYIHPEDRELVLNRHLRRLAGEDVPQNYDFRIVSKNGEVKWVQISAVRINWEGLSATLNFLVDITERKNAEETLRKSEERYRAFFNTSIDCVFITTVDGRWIDFNDAAVKFFGFDSRDELMKTRIEDLYANPSDRKRHIEHIIKCGYSKEYPVTLKRKDGTIIETLITAVAVKDPGGAVIGFQGTIRNVTEQKRVERELQVSRERLMLALEGSGVGLWDWYVQTGEVTFSERWAEIVGYTLDELSPVSIETWKRLAHPEDLKRSDHMLSLHFAGVLPTYECEVRMLHKDGHWVLVLDRGKVVEWDNDGKPVRMAGTQLDITDRKRAEEALRESAELYRTVVDSATDGIILQDGSGRILTWNKGAERVFGISAEKAIGQTSISRDWRTIREDGSEFPGSEHPSMRTLLTGEPCRNVVMGVRNALTDRLQWININTSPLFREGETKPYAVIISFSDITERKEFEDELERRVDERTQELRSKTAEMERFIYTVSHDLRSPLVTISGFLGLLEHDILKGDAELIRSDLQMIGKAVEKMDLLLQDTLELSRIGRVANQFEYAPLGQLVHEALEQTTRVIADRGVEVHVPPDMPVVHVDRMRMVEVFVNLIENSVKYMGDEPHPRIDIGYRKEGSETVFFVRDNGIGIDPSQRDKVFELFYKIDPKSEGTGVGLAIVKRIIEVHGGRIWIESGPEKGCTVCFTLAS
ncbi:MAG: PAS domain S-box protein [Methanothrix sp.]|nr:PAS domain S-box protein [Methanothrix sp.]MCX8206722.1 PAS domain S-box protein [Methanothrix sp.]